MKVPRKGTVMMPEAPKENEEHTMTKQMHYYVDEYYVH